MRLIAPMLAVILILPVLVSAEIYQVDNQALCSDSGPGTETEPWCTIQHAAYNIQRGDIVYVHEGGYSEYVNIPVNGTTFIANAGDTVSMCGWQFENRNDTRIIGFDMDNDYGSCTRRNGVIQMTGSNAFIEIWNSNFRDSRYNGIRMGISDSCSNCLIIGNRFEDIGFDELGEGTGSGNAISIWGNNNLIAYNFMTNMDPDNIVFAGENVIIENNYGETPYYFSSAHADFLQHGPMDGLLFGLVRNTIEANYYDAGGGIENGHSHVAILQNYAEYGAPDPYENIIRGNLFHDIGSGDIGVDRCEGGTCSYYRIYHNTFADSCVHNDLRDPLPSGYADSSTKRYGTTIYGTGVSDTFYHNNILYETWGDFADPNYIYGYYIEGGVTSDYNLAYDPDDQTIPFATSAPIRYEPNAQLNVDPGFIDYDNDNFYLKNAGGAYENASNLTYVTSVDGTGTIFTVADAGFFKGDNALITQYGGNLVIGDTITVGTDTLQIESIDYTTNQITVTTSFNWQENDPVCWGDDSIPDIGAYPYRASGYYLSATYTSGSGTVSVEPSDPSLVRFVIVYEDNIPIGVDSIYPYSVSGVGSGSIEVLVYPLYASSVLSVTATEGIPQSCPYCCSSGNVCSNPTAGTGCQPSETCCASSGDCEPAPYCGDGTCNGDDDCSNCPGDCPTGSGEVCCSGVIYAGDCCGDGDCTILGQTCQNNFCTDPPPDTCQSLGYQCCDSCALGPQTQYDSGCPGQVCCTLCEVSCIDSGDFFHNTAIDQQTQFFVFRYTATPLNDNLDGLVMLSPIQGTSFNDYAILVRFNDTGYIDARNGDVYSADNDIPYSANTEYRFRVISNLQEGSYSAYVTPESGSEQVITDSYSYRTSQQGITEINYMGTRTQLGTMSVCDYMTLEIHESDIDTNGCVETGEMIAFMDRWKISSTDVTMVSLMSSIGLWKMGTGCR